MRNLSVLPFGRHSKKIPYRKAPQNLKSTKNPIDVFPQVRIARVDAMFRFVSKWIPRIFKVL